MTSLEILTELASTARGFAYLDSNGVLTKLAGMVTSGVDMSGGSFDTDLGPPDTAATQLTPYDARASDNPGMEGFIFPSVLGVRLLAGAPPQPVPNGS